MPDIQLTVGKKATVKLTPLTADGQPATNYQSGSIHITSSDTKVFSIYPSTTSDKYASLVAVCPGTATGIVTWTSHLGNTFTKTFTVEIDAFEAVDIRIEFIPQ